MNKCFEILSLGRNSELSLQLLTEPPLTPVTSLTAHPYFGFLSSVSLFPVPVPSQVIGSNLRDYLHSLRVLSGGDPKLKLSLHISLTVITIDKDDVGQGSKYTTRTYGPEIYLL